MNEEKNNSHTTTIHWPPYQPQNPRSVDEPEMSRGIGELAKALCKAQGEMHHAKKDSSNPFFKSSYADLASHLDAAREPLSKNGLAIAQPVVIVGGETYLKTILMHTSGEWISSLYPVKPVKPDPQSMGSCLTYARRYSFSAMIGQASEDDDGQAASKGGYEKLPFEKDAIIGRVAQGDSDPAEYVVQVGKKYKGKKLREIPTSDIADFMMWLQDQSHKKNEKLVGFAKEFVETASVYLDELNHKETP